MPKKLHKPVAVPHELHQALVRNKAALKKFGSLPPSHQREYIEYVIEAKKMQTKRQRIKKIITDLSNPS